MISAPATLTLTPTVVAPGGAVQLPSWMVTNQGTVASNAFSNGFYLSTDATITPADVYLDGNSNAAKAPGEFFTWGGPRLTIPATTAPGNYFIGILVDRTNTTPELNEGNNFKSTPLTVEGIAFWGNRDGNDEIYLMNADGSGIRRLTTDASEDRDPAWSPNGSRIAFARQESDGLEEIYVVNVNDGGIFRLTNVDYADQPAWSPDGSKIAFTGWGEISTEIYFMNSMDGSGMHRLMNDASLDADPAWSPDGNQIAFTSDRAGNGNWEIYRMNLEGNGIVRLTFHPGSDYEPAWSPDGSKIAFVSVRDGNHEIYVMNAYDGRGLCRLTNNASIDVDPRWSPDGSKIAFASDRDGNDEIYVMNVDDGGIVRLTNNASADAGPSWAGAPLRGAPAPPTLRCLP